MAAVWLSKHWYAVEYRSENQYCTLYMDTASIIVRLYEILIVTFGNAAPVPCPVACGLECSEHE